MQSNRETSLIKYLFLKDGSGTGSTDSLFLGLRYPNSLK